MKIGVDIDGVILDLGSKVCEIFNSLYDTNYTKNDVKRWEFFRDWEVPEEIIYDIFDKAYQQSSTIALIDNDAPHILEKLHKVHDLDLVTARNKKFESHLVDRLNFLEIRKGVQYGDLIHVEPKPYDAKIALNYEILIDDNPNLIKPIIIFPKKRLLLFEQPWNRNLEEKENVKKVKNWKQIEGLLIN